MRGFLLAFFLGLATATYAQEAAYSQTPVLILDWERIFADSRVAQGVLGGIERQRSELVNENLRIQKELTAEELELTELRSTLSAAEFRERADAFDQKVQSIREERDAKERELQRRRVEERWNFRIAVEKTLISDIMRERGAFLVLDRSATSVFATSIDITEEAISRMGPLLNASSRPESQSENMRETPLDLE